MASVQVRMNEITKRKFDSLVSEINDERVGNERFPLTTAELLDHAVELLIKYKSGLLF